MALNLSAKGAFYVFCAVMLLSSETNSPNNVSQLFLVFFFMIILTYHTYCFRDRIGIIQPVNEWVTRVDPNPQYNIMYCKVHVGFMDRHLSTVASDFTQHVCKGHGSVCCCESTNSC